MIRRPLTTALAVIIPMIAPPSLSTGTAYAAEPIQWEVREEGMKSLTFSTTQMGAAFTGHFTAFTPQITFHPDALTDSKVQVDVPLKTANTDDEERDETLQSAAWFNSAAHPIASFTATTFTENTGDNAEEFPYIAEGILDLSGTAQDITLPFAFTIESDSKPAIARAHGEATLNRMDFGLGAEDWDDPDSVGHMVKVEFTLDLVEIVSQ